MKLFWTIFISILKCWLFIQFGYYTCNQPEQWVTVITGCDTDMMGEGCFCVDINIVFKVGHSPSSEAYVSYKPAFTHLNVPWITFLLLLCKMKGRNSSGWLMWPASVHILNIPWEHSRCCLTSGGELHQNCYNQAKHNYSSNQAYFLLYWPTSAVLAIK